VLATEEVGGCAECGLELLLELPGPRDVTPDGRYRGVLAGDL